jgi:hypothetical protein
MTVNIVNRMVLRLTEPVKIKKALARKQTKASLI